MVQLTVASALVKRSNLGRICSLFVAVVVLLALVGIRPAYAAGLTLIVDTNSDANLTACTAAPNDCSLRGAINAANSAGGSNIIVFDGTVFYFGGSITLGSNLPAVTSTLSISGPGATLMTVNGAGSYRPFTVNGGGNLTLNGLTISGGYANNSTGGAVNNNGTLTVTNSVITNNSSAGFSSYGGGISNNGTLTVSSSTFSGNSAQDNPGGALASSGGTVTVTDSSFNGNSSSNSVGGAIYVNGGTLSVTSSTLSGNSASSSGGGVYNDGSTITLINTTLSNNNAANTGGAIYNNAGTLTLTDCSFTNNQTVNVPSFGGGIYSNSATTIIRGCTFNGNFSRAGGAVSINGGSLTMSNSTLDGNTARAGGGVYNDSAGTVTITNSTFSTNNSTVSGGSVYNVSGTMDVNNTIIDSNIGADCVRVGGTINVRNSFIADDPTFACANGVSVNNLSGNPMLGPFGNNGGVTDTIALQAGSPAINAGDNALAVDANGNPLTTDQRGSGYDRIFGGTVDMGAYEAAYTYNFVVDTTSDADLEGCSSSRQ